MKSNLCEAGSELRSVDQKDRNVAVLFNDWLEQNGYQPFADWVNEARRGVDGSVCRHDEEQQPKCYYLFA